MLSLPVPPVRTFAPDEPMIEIAAESPDASTFWKFETPAVSPTVWSALARLTFAAARITSVLVPAPPSIESSEP